MDALGKKHDLLFEQLRTLAVNHPGACPYCHAETGQICVNNKTGALLVNIPANYARIKIAGYPDVEDPKC